MWKWRDISEDSLHALHLLLEMSKARCDGVVLSNHCLQNILGLNRVFSQRAKEFAGRISHIFPFYLVKRDRQGCTTLCLGVSVDKPPDHPLHVSRIAEMDQIEKSLHVYKVEISVKG